MAHPIWPLFGIEVRTPRVVLRYADDVLATELALLAARGIHDPAHMPFSVPWTDAAPRDLERGSLQYYWDRRAATSPQAFDLLLAIIADGTVIGGTSIHAIEFAVLRQVSTGSWLGLPHQGKGYGRELREATLHLAFAGLGAVRAVSGAFVDNERSNRVSRRLGYRENGTRWMSRRGEPAQLVDYVLERDDWERIRRDDITIHGLDDCLPLLGLA